MSGGIAYVYDETGLFDTRCNLDMVDLESVWTPADQATLRGLIEHHLSLTGSAQARMILDNWESRLPYFVKVMPIEYRISLERMRQEADMRSRNGLGHGGGLQLSREGVPSPKENGRSG